METPPTTENVEESETETISSDNTEVGTAEPSSGEEDTQKTSLGEEEPAEDKPQAKNRTHADWEDHFPPLEYTRPENITDRLEVYKDELDQRLAAKEVGLLAKIDQDIHQSYYNMWVDEANWIFRSAVTIKARQQRMRRKKDDATEEDVPTAKESHENV